MKKKEYDLAVIGAGPGGYVAALHAAQLGLKTVCIDKREEPGGTCLNVGCIPSKCLLHSTERYFELKQSGKENGINCSDLTFDFSVMREHKKKVVSSLVGSVRSAFKARGVDFITGEASFLDPNRLVVGSNKQEITAANILISTGSDSIELDFLLFDEKQILSSTGLLNLSSVPKSLIVIGAGVIGVELASVYARLGTQVTIIEMLDHICPAIDEALSKHLLKLLTNQGMTFYLKSQVMTAVVQPNEVIVTINQEERLINLSAEKVLVAIGRKPFTDGLGLDKIGIAINKKGFIPINDYFQTTQKHIYAIGDVIEGIMLAHRSSEEGIAVVEMIANKNPRPVNYLSIPNVIYTNPEVASVGLTEKEARTSQLEIKTGMSYFKGNARARCVGETDGFVKVIGDSKTGRLVGMHIIGSQASEMIAEGMMAMEKKATLRDLAYAPNAHPTLSETIKDAALNALE